MEDELDRLRAEGRAESEGRFTVDRRRAAELLRSRRLADPHRWVLKAVQWAVASGARRVDVEVSARQAWVSHDGRPEPDLERLVCGAGMRHLEVAVAAALALEGPGLQVMSGGRMLDLQPDGAFRVVAVEGGPVSNLFTVFKPESGLRAVLPRGQRPETRLVPQRCAWAPVPVYLNRRCVNRRWPPPGTVAEVAAGQARLARTRRSTSEVLFVKDGVVVWESRDLLPLPGLVAVVDARGLQVDLSEFGLVRDEEFVRVVEALRRAAASLNR